MSDRLAHLLARTALEAATTRRLVFQLLTRHLTPEEARRLNQAAWTGSVDSLRNPPRGCASSWDPGTAPRDPQGRLCHPGAGRPGARQGRGPLRHPPPRRRRRPPVPQRLRRRLRPRVQGRSLRPPRILRGRLLLPTHLWCREKAAVSTRTCTTGRGASWTTSRNGPASATGWPGPTVWRITSHRDAGRSGTFVRVFHNGLIPTTGL
jgi:hypothetical protein